MTDTKHRYLYGASVQGIQGFIFQTNDLKDIAGASELVEEICTDLFLEIFFGREEVELKTAAVEQWIAAHQVIAAAGNVKYILEEEECRKAVRIFPRMVMKAAPGITISQAVVEYTGDDQFGHHVNELERKLRTERNRPSIPLTTGLLGMRRSRKTGFPIAAFEKDGKSQKLETDLATNAKVRANNTLGLCKKSFGFKPAGELAAFDADDITGQNDWIAIIHADGNSLGQVVQSVGHNREQYSRFSKALDEATAAAANAAYAKVAPEGGWGGKIPVRPVVLSGDDMTVIIRGDLAMTYVEEYMRQFEVNTGEGDLGQIIKDNDVFPDGPAHLSACAGVAFIKASYPFYFGYQLAEELCTEAKRVAKDGLAKGQPARSCLMFHKVQDSFVTSYKDIISRELTPAHGPSLKFGPYFIKDEATHDSKFKEYATIGKLMEWQDSLDNFEGVRTGLRQWLTLLHDGNGRDKQHLERLLEINQKDPGATKLIKDLTDERHEAVAAQDCLTLYTIKHQKTRRINDEI